MSEKILSGSAKKREQRNNQIKEMYLNLKNNGTSKTVCYNNIADEFGVCLVTVIKVLKGYQLI